LETELRDLSRLDDGRLAEMFQQRGLNAELKQRDSDAAFDLHMSVVMARRALVRSQTSAGPRRVASPSEPVHDWLHAFLGARKLTRPDERPLYRYRMADSEYEQAKEILRRLGASLRRTNAQALCSLRIARSGSVVSRPRLSFDGTIQRPISFHPCRALSRQMSIGHFRRRIPMSVSTIPEQNSGAQSRVGAPAGSIEFSLTMPSKKPQSNSGASETRQVCSLLTATSGGMSAS
jgi:hypothetical protein